MIVPNVLFLDSNSGSLFLREENDDYKFHLDLSSPNLIRTFKILKKRMKVF